MLAAVSLGNRFARFLTHFFFSRLRLALSMIRIADKAGLLPRCLVTRLASGAERILLAFERGQSFLRRTMRRALAEPRPLQQLTRGLSTSGLEAA